MLDELISFFREKYPTKRITYLNQKNEKYSGEYLVFNLDILKEIMKRTTLDYEIMTDGVYIKGDKGLFSRLLFECAILAELDEKSSLVILRPYVTATDVMRSSCAILKIFEKTA